MPIQFPVRNPLPALRLETRFQKPEPKSEPKMTKLKPHHRLELNDVFQKEIQFHFKLDVSDIFVWIFTYENILAFIGKLWNKS